MSEKPCTCPGRNTRDVDCYFHGDRKKYTVEFFTPKGFFGPPAEIITVEGTKEIATTQIMAVYAKYPNGTTMTIQEVKQ